MNALKNRELFAKSGRRRSAQPFLAEVEPLERRMLLTAVVVNSVLDIASPPPGTVTLRSAIAVANASTTPTTITFDPTVFATSQTILLNGTSLGMTNTAQSTTITGPSVGLTLNANNQSGGIINDGTATLSNLVIENSNFTGFNTVGSGIENAANGGNLTLHSVTVSNCVATAFGGGIGGIDNGGTMSISASTIENNTGVYCGGIENEPGATLTIVGSTIDGNTSQNAGGIYNNGGTVTLKDVTISGNSVAEIFGITGNTGSGGGIYNTFGGSFTATNITLSGNSAQGYGGGLANDDLGNVVLSDSTVSQNTAGLDGGGIYEFPVRSPSITVDNSVIASNTSISAAPDVYGQFNSLGYNLISYLDINSTGWTAADITGTAASPINPMLGALANNGGQTKTMLPQTGSPAIDAGSNALIPAGVTTDQRGFARIYNGTVDIGAVETQPLGITITAPATQSAYTGHSASFALGSFTAVNTTAPYTVTVNWGDTSTATTFAASTAGTIAAQTHTFAAFGTDTVTVTVTDATGLLTGSATFRVTVSYGTITVTPPAAQAAPIGTSSLFSLGSFSQLYATAPFTVDVNWGDGTTNTKFTANAAGTVASQSHSYAAGGADTVTVTVMDASGVVTGSGTFGVTVNTGSTASATTLQSTSGSILFSQSVTLTATVTPSTAVGIVTFLENGVMMGTANVGSGGVATFTTSSLKTGSDSITAKYGGSATYATSTSTPVVIVVATPPNTTTISVIASSSSISTDQFVSLLATVVSAGGAGEAATGTVTFYRGSNVLGATALQPDGTATLNTTTGFPTGTDPVDAVYGGDTNFSGSTSAAINITVIPTSTVTATLCSTPSKTVAQAVTLEATIKPSAAVTANLLDCVIPRGSVIFSDNGIVIGTAAVGPAGVADLTTTAAFSTGINLVTASYSGDSAFTASASATTEVYVTEHALVPVVTRTVVPASVIAGTSLHSSISATLTNDLHNLGSGVESGAFTVTIFASSTTTLDGNDPVVASILRHATIRPGRSTRITVPIHSFPATLATGTYHLLLQTTDAAGNIEWIDTGATANVIAPVISLSASFVSVPSNVLKKGAMLSITTTGNVNDLSTFTAVVGFSTDPAGHNIVAAGAGKLKPSKFQVRLGKSTKVRFTRWQSLLAGLPTASYYLTVTLTDANGNSAVAVSQQTI